MPRSCVLSTKDVVQNFRHDWKLIVNAPRALCKCLVVISGTTTSRHNAATVCEEHQEHSK